MGTSTYTDAQLWARARQMANLMAQHCDPATFQRLSSFDQTRLMRAVEQLHELQSHVYAGGSVPPTPSPWLEHHLSYYYGSRLQNLRDGIQAIVARAEGSGGAAAAGGASAGGAAAGTAGQAGLPGGGGPGLGVRNGGLGSADPLRLHWGSGWVGLPACGPAVLPLRVGPMFHRSGQQCGGLGPGRLYVEPRRTSTSWALRHRGRGESVRARRKGQPETD